MEDQSELDRARRISALRIQWQQQHQYFRGVHWCGLRVERQQQQSQYRRCSARRKLHVVTNLTL